MIQKIQTNGKVWNKNNPYQLPKNDKDNYRWYLKKIIQVVGF